MTSLQAAEYEVSPSYGQVRERLPASSVLLGIFVLAAVAISRLEVGNWVVRGLGVILGVAYVFRLLRARVRPSPEMVAHFSWVSWSLIALLGGAYATLFWEGFGTIVQVWILLVIMSGLTSTRRMLSFNLIMYLIGALVMAGHSYITGEYQVAEQEGTRVAGLAMNANEFAWILLLAVVAMAYLWMLPTRGKAVKYALLATGIVAAGLAIILSGSRKGILGYGALILLWVWICYRKEVLRRPGVLAAIVLLLAMGGYGFVRSVSRASVGERFGRTWQAMTGGQTRGSGFERFLIYRESFEILAKRPLLGVGLLNHQVHSSIHAMAHSEYMEVACATGIFGFAIYFSIFAFTWSRTKKIIKYSDDPAEVQIARLIRVFLIVVMLMNFGRWNYTNKAFWIVFGSFVGYTQAVWLSIRSRNEQQELSETAQGEEYTYA